MSDVSHAQLDWDEQGQPRSRSFDDVYFSRASGLGETRHVFLDGNHLAVVRATGSARRTIALCQRGKISTAER